MRTDNPSAAELLRELRQKAASGKLESYSPIWVRVDDFLASLPPSSDNEVKE
jgi:hypothetical protein